MRKRSGRHPERRKDDMTQTKTQVAKTGDLIHLYPIMKDFKNNWGIE